MPGDGVFQLNFFYLHNQCMDMHRLPLKSIAGRKGFTLIETLVAVMILSISLVVIMQLFSGGLKSNKLSTDYLYGIFHAREKMEELLLSEELRPGSYDGEFDDGYQWSAVIGILEEELDSEGERNDRMPVATMSIMLDVSWQMGNREKHYKLATTALVDKQALEENAE